MKRKISHLKEIKNKELLETKYTLKCKKLQRSCPKIVTSEAFQRVTDETLQESHLKFGITDEAQTFEFQKNERHRIMEERISFRKQKTATF